MYKKRLAHTETYPITGFFSTPHTIHFFTSYLGQSVDRNTHALRLNRSGVERNKARKQKIPSHTMYECVPFVPALRFVRFWHEPLGTFCKRALTTMCIARKSSLRASTANKTNAKGSSGLIVSFHKGPRQEGFHQQGTGTVQREGEWPVVLPGCLRSSGQLHHWALSAARLRRHSSIARYRYN